MKSRKIIKLTVVGWKKTTVSNHKKTDRFPRKLSVRAGQVDAAEKKS